MGTITQEFLVPLIGQEILIVASIILTIIATIVLLKVDVTKIADKILKRKNRAS